MRTLRFLVLMVTLLLPSVSGFAAADLEDPVVDNAGLEDFIQARMLETGGDYREAVKAYESAMRKAPAVSEIRIRYASLLLDLGMSERAVEVLGGASDLDWFGQRVLALALAQDSARNPASLQPAEEALEAALSERDDDPNLLLAMGQVYHRTGQIEEAERVIAQLRQSRGGSPQLAAYHAGLLRQLDRPLEAAEVYADCTEVNFAGGVDCRQNLVQLLIEEGRPGEAGEMMLGWLTDDDLDELMRAASLLYEGGHYTSSLETVQRVLRHAPDSPRARALEAYLLSRLGRYEEAVVRLRVMQRKQRDNMDVLLSLAWANGNLGQMDEARKWIDRAWEIVQEDAASEQATRVALSAARIELLGDETWRAREWLGRVADPEKGGGELAYLLAESYRQEEQWEEGIAALLRLQPRLTGPARLDAQAYEAEFRLRVGDPRGANLLRPLLDSDDRRQVLIGLGVLQTMDRWDEVESEAESAIERMPGDRDLMFTRAAALERLGRFDESEELFREILEDNPEDASAANYLGYSLADRGEDLDEAMELISRAVELEPDNSSYLDSLGWVHYRLGDLDQAEYWLRRAVEIGGDEGTVLAHLGEVLMRQGKDEEARGLLLEALSLGCEDPEHVRQLLEGTDH